MSKITNQMICNLLAFMEHNQHNKLEFPAAASLALNSETNTDSFNKTTTSNTKKTTSNTKKTTTTKTPKDNKFY